MAQDLIAGDFLVFQLESGYGLLRVVAIEDLGNDTVWHVAAYDEFFLEVEDAELSISSQKLPKPSHAHIALTNRAFLSTQVAKLVNIALTDSDIAGYKEWLEDSAGEISDRSVRLMMGLR